MKEALCRLQQSQKLVHIQSLVLNTVDIHLDVWDFQSFFLLIDFRFISLLHQNNSLIKWKITYFIRKFSKQNFFFISFETSIQLLVSSLTELCKMSPSSTPHIWIRSQPYVSRCHSHFVSKGWVFVFYVHFIYADMVLVWICKRFQFDVLFKKIFFDGIRIESNHWLTDKTKKIFDLYT